MKDIVIVPYKPNDLYRIPGYTDWVPGLDGLFLSGDTVTGSSPDGEIVFVAGLKAYWPGNAEAYVVFRPDIKRYVRSFAVIRDLLEERIRTHHLCRVTAHCRTDWPQANRLLNHLGFRYEGLLRAYGPAGEDYNVYGRIVGWPK